VTTAILDENLQGGDIVRCDVLGVGVSAVNIPTSVRQIHQWIERREHHYVCITGVHGVMESQRDPVLKRIHNDAGMVTPDACRWCGSIGCAGTATSPASTAPS